MFDRYVATHARFSPDRVALEDKRVRWSYAELEQKIAQTAARLEPLCEMQLRSVGIEGPNDARHWLLILALGRLGLTSCSLPPVMEGVTDRFLEILSPDLIIRFGVPNALADLDESLYEILYLEESWFHALPDAPLDRDYPSAEIARTALAGATMGQAVPLSLDKDALESYVLRLGWLDLAMDRAHAQSSILVATVHPSSLSGFTAVCAALSCATTVRFHDVNEPQLAFIGSGPFTALTTPAHLAMILDALPPTAQPRPEITLIAGGGRVSDKLAQRCNRLLTPHLRIAFASDETGPVTMIEARLRKNASQAGRLLPWADIRITDPRGGELPIGEMGEIRLKLPRGVSVSGTDGSWTAESARYGADRWLRTGDLGSLEFQDGALCLTLAGRCDDLATLGGGKFDLAKIERALREHETLKDAACFVYEDDKGRERIGCAVILETGKTKDVKALGVVITDLYPILSGVPVFWTDSLPRDLFGVIDRQALAKAAKGRIPAKAGGG